MGKRYFCEYCNKTMVATPAIVRTHNNGLSHLKLLQDHYRQFKDPETILKEEAYKKPCVKFHKGECHFGSVCRFSHYSREEIDSLREYVSLKTVQNVHNQPISFLDLYQKLQDEKMDNATKVMSDEQETIIYDSNGVTHKFPWVYNNALNDCGVELPPSIKKICLEDFKDAEFVEWG